MVDNGDRGDDRCGVTDWGVVCRLKPVANVNFGKGRIIPLCEFHTGFVAGFYSALGDRDILTIEAINRSDPSDGDRSDPSDGEQKR